MEKRSSSSGQGLRGAFVAVTTLFFAWGFITALIDPLMPSVSAIFHLSYTQMMLTSFAFFISYGVVSLPGAALVARAGYSRSILIALAARQGSSRRCTGSGLWSSAASSAARC